MKLHLQLPESKSHDKVFKEEVPGRISHSQIETWFDCRRKWHYSYVRGLRPLKVQEWFKMGDYLHGKLDIYYQLYRQTRDPGKLAEMMDDLILEDLQEDAQNGDLIIRAMKVMRKYCIEYSPMKDQGIKVIETEFHFEMPLTTPKGRECILEGYVDLLYERNGQIFVRDHKTTAKPNNFRTAEETDYDPQQATYIAGLRGLGIPVHCGEVSELITFNYKNYVTEPVDKVMRLTPTWRTDALIAKMYHWYSTVLDEMAEETKFTEHLHRGCKFCPFRSPCSIRFQGGDEKKLLELGFKEKDGWNEYHAAG